MTKSMLRSEKTQVGKEIWKAVDEAAARAPELVKETIIKVANKDQTRDLSVGTSKQGVTEPRKAQKKPGTQKARGPKSKE